MYFLANYYRFFKNTRPFITNCQRQAKALDNQKNLCIFAGKNQADMNNIKNIAFDLGGVVLDTVSRDSGVVAMIIR